MAYAVFKWNFNTAVHFGTNKGQLAQTTFVLKSDTIFSALCHECLKLGGVDLLDKFYHQCAQNEIGLSDGLPFCQETYYLPKPIIPVDRQEKEHSSVLKKNFKNLKYLSAERFEDYLQSLKGNSDFDVQSENEAFKKIVSADNRVMAAVKGQEETQPFYVGTYQFAAGAGLYMIVYYQKEDTIAWLETIMNSLGLSGIGGEKSSGLGHFTVDDVIFLDDVYSEGLEALQKLLSVQQADYYMTLSCCLPTEQELPKVLSQPAHYSLLKRSGFVASYDYASQPMKKKTLYVFDSGSCFKQKFCGDIYDIARGGKHKVYRYAKSMFIGVKI